MPRKKITITDNVEYLSILDEHGVLDKELEPDASDGILLKLYRAMLLGRKFDERLLNLQRQGRIGTFPPISGQEASQLGAVAQLRPSDWLVPSFRETAAEIWRGKDLEDIIIYYNGHNWSGESSTEHNNLPMAIPVGSQIIHAAGLGWAANYRKKDDVIMTFFGDGATSEGDFHEGLNFAAVYQSPVVFVCQNNQWAISIPLSRQTHSKTLAQKAVAYGMPGIQVDGNDILAVYSAAEEAIKRARTGGGPTFIECVTYRVMMHTTADDPKRYRTEEEVESWRKKDPIPRFQKYLIEKGLLSVDDPASIEEEVLKDIQKAIDRAEEMMKDMSNPLKMFDHFYDTLPPHLKNQRQELQQRISGRVREDHHG